MSAGYPISSESQTKRRRSGEPVEKSPNDKLEYRLLSFDNGFEALLISTSDAKKNKAAAAVTAGVGSFSDPQGRCEGLAHYLEHMLFMGSAKYPGEDQMEEFLSKNGGYSNAFTEAAHTCYYLEVNKAELHTALDMLAQFFVAPLMKVDAAGREINAIDSEFRLTQNSDGSRVEQLFASFAQKGHPFRTFGWGNLKSLKEATEKAGVDLNAELRAFHSTHYRAPRLRLCVYGVEPLDSLEKVVRESFKGLPIAPADEPAEGPQEAFLAKVGKPFAPASLPKMLRVRPVKDIHKLSLSWMLPPMQHLYKSNPVGYLQHLVGHEGAGSLLSFLKRQGMATGLSAGVGEDSFESNSMCAIFNIDITLTASGLEAWPDVAHATFLYLDMLRKEGPQEWVHKELVLVQDMGWRFLEESNPTDQVQHLACHMLPVYKIEAPHVLKWPWMSTEWNAPQISAMLAEMLPERLMLDVLSSAFGRAKAAAEEAEDGADDDEAVAGEGDGPEGDDDDDGEGSEEEDEAADDDEEEDQAPPAKDPNFDPESNPPSVEPLFGTEYWDAKQDEVQALLARWAKAPAADSWLTEAKTALHLPPKNTFLATDFDLRPPPAKGSQDAEAPELPAGGLRALYPEFPPLPAPLPQEPRPLEQAASLGMRAWHLQDTVFMTPRSELWLKLSTDQSPLESGSARAQVCLALLCRVMSDTLNETSYLAEQAGLHVRIRGTEYGVDVIVGGFHHKLPMLMDAVLSEVLSFGDKAAWDRRVQDAAFQARMQAQRESLLRAYRNAYLKPGDQAADMRRLLVMPNKQAAPAKAAALEGVDEGALAAFAQALIPKLRAEVLLTGNNTVSDAEELVKGLPETLREGAAGSPLKPLPAHPETRVAVVPDAAPTVWIEDSPDNANPNAAVEMFWQLEATEKAFDKAVVDLMEDLMSEPLFDTLRTKQQLGYVASCGLRYTQGVLGFSIWLLSSKVGIAEICRRVEAFLVEFRQRVVDLPDQDIAQHACSLAGHKVEPDRTLTSVQEGVWNELAERKRVFNRPLTEAVALSTVKRSDILRVLDDFILKAAKRRRLLVIGSVGGKAKSTRATDVQELKQDYPGAREVKSQADFLKGTTLFDALV